MSRKYINDRWCIRCNKDTPTPYLAKNFDKIVNKDTKHIVDIGCGNCRNTNFCRSQGYKVSGIDMATTNEIQMVLGKDKLPFEDNSVQLILANYIFMFLNKKERSQVLKEIKRIAATGCYIMVELYPAKDSLAPSKPEILKLQKEIFDKLDWTKIRSSIRPGLYTKTMPF